MRHAQECPTARYSEITRLSRCNRRSHYHGTRRRSEVEDMNRPEPTISITRAQKRPCALARTRHHRHRLPIALAALSSALALAACGGSSKPSSTNPSSASGSPSSFAQSQLKVARCIRSHGVPNFPDPTFGAGGAQVNLQTPRGMLTSAAFELAQTDVRKARLGARGLRRVPRKAVRRHHGADAGRSPNACARTECRTSPIRRRAAPRHTPPGTAPWRR